MANYNEEEYMTISIDDVPEWLRDSERFRKVEKSEGEFEIPSRFFIQSPIVNWIEDFKNVIEAMEFWEVKRIPHSVFLFTIYHHSQGYQHVKELFPHLNIWEKLDIFIYYIQQLTLTMDMVNLSASSRTIYPLMVRFAKHGFIDCIEFCLSLFQDDKRETDYLLNSSIYIHVVNSKLNKKRKIKALQRLKDLGFPLCNIAEILDSDCFLWFYKNGAQLDLEKAITNGVKNKEIFELACYKNKIELVSMLIERNCPCDSNSFLRAIENSNLDMLKMLIAYIPCEVNEEVINKAIEVGNLDCIKYLYRNYPRK